MKKLFTYIDKKVLFWICLLDFLLFIALALWNQTSPIVSVIGGLISLIVVLFFRNKILKLIGSCAYIIIVGSSAFVYPGWTQALFLIAIILGVEFLYPNLSFLKKGGESADTSSGREKIIVYALASLFLFPVVGYFNNPFRLGAKNTAEAWHLISSQNEEDYSEFDGYLGDISNPETLLGFKELVEVSGDGQSTYSGIWYKHDFDLELVHPKGSAGIDITVRSYQDKTVSFSDFTSLYDRFKDSGDYALPNRYHDFYRIGQLNSDRGSYNVYLRMNKNWVKTYSENPDNVVYDVLIFDRRIPVRDAYVETND